MDLTEKVARAIAEHQHQGWIFSDDQRIVEMCIPAKVEKAKQSLMDAARAAIEIVRGHG